jgi:hypothetical protein
MNSYWLILFIIVLLTIIAKNLNIMNVIERFEEPDPETKEEESVAKIIVYILKAIFFLPWAVIKGIDFLYTLFTFLIVG